MRRTGRPTIASVNGAWNSSSAALEAEQEVFREELILEVGCPRMITNGPQLDVPVGEAIKWPAKHIDESPWSNDLADGLDQFGRPAKP